MGFLDRLRGKPASAGTVTDPVCGMGIDPAKAAGSARHGSETYHFCSAACKGKFDADPHRYLGEHAH